LRGFFDGIEAGEDGVKSLCGGEIIFLGIREEVYVVGKNAFNSKVTDALFVKVD